MHVCMPACAGYGAWLLLLQQGLVKPRRAPKKKVEAKREFNQDEWLKGTNFPSQVPTPYRVCMIYPSHAPAPCMHTCLQRASTPLFPCRCLLRRPAFTAFTCKIHACMMSVLACRGMPHTSLWHVHRSWPPPGSSFGPAVCLMNACMHDGSVQNMQPGKLTSHMSDQSCVHADTGQEGGPQAEACGGCQGGACGGCNSNPAASGGEEDEVREGSRRAVGKLEGSCCRHGVVRTTPVS